MQLKGFLATKSCFKKKRKRRYSSHVTLIQAFDLRSGDPLCKYFVAPAALIGP